MLWDLLPCTAACAGVMGLMAPLQPVSLTQALPDFVLTDDIPLPSMMSSRLLSAVSWIFFFNRVAVSLLWKCLHTVLPLCQAVLALKV